MDEIELAGLTFFGTHGVNAEETELGQRFGLDLTLWLDTRKAAESDAIGDTVSYSAIYKLVRREMEGEPSKLSRDAITEAYFGLSSVHDERTT